MPRFLVTPAAAARIWGTMRRRLERTFARYRERGDLAALAEVFDRTAPDLLRLAQHFAREDADAEDLLQETFVTAIERASSYDPARPLLPWLAGILAHKARGLARRELRSYDAERLERAAADGPLEAASARELDVELQRALARLEAGERELLERHLGGERTPAELARELGLAPGTVRMRIHRALGRVRRLLPAGIGAGALAALPRPLSAVRREVLAHAARAAGAESSVSLAASASTLAVLVMTKTATLLCALAGAAALTGALRFAGNEPAPSARAPRELALDSESVAAADARPSPALGQLAPTPAEGADEPSPDARSAPPRRSLVLDGRVLGVDPVELADVRVRVSAVSMGSAPPREQGETGCAGALQGMSCAICHDVGPHERSMARPQGAQAGTDERAALVLPLLDAVPLLGAVAAGRSAAAVVAQPDAEGRFSIELAGLCARAEDALSGSFAVSADCDRYFGALAIIELWPAQRERFLANEAVRLYAELELLPLARLCGKVATQAESLVSLAITPLLESHATNIPSTRLLLEMQPRQISTAEVALLRLEDGLPIGPPLARTYIRPDQGFQLDLAEEGSFLLVALQPGSRPRAFRVELRLRETVELEPFALEPGFVLDGTLAGPLPREMEAQLVTARRRELPGEHAFELEAHELVLTRESVEWRSASAQVDERGRFSIAGLAPDVYTLAAPVSADLDLARAGYELECTAPAGGIMLAPDLARIDVRLARRGRALDRLPMRVEGASGPSGAITVRVHSAEGERTGAFDLAGRTRGVVLAEPLGNVRFELLVGGELRDAAEILVPPAGARAQVLLELGEL